MWRPKEGWENPFKSVSEGGHLESPTGASIFEAGADAMLQTLLKPFSLETPNLDMTAFPEYKIELRCRIIPSDPWLLCESMEIIKTKGKLVFIPERD